MMSLYDPNQPVDQSVIYGLTRLTDATESNHAVHVMETGMDNEVLSLEPYASSCNWLVKLTFRVAAGIVPRDGDILAAPHDDFPFEHVELHQSVIQTKKPHQYFLFDVQKIPDVAGQWQAHAIRNQPLQGWGHVIHTLDENRPVPTTFGSRSFISQLEATMGYGPLA